MLSMYFFISLVISSILQIFEDETINSVTYIFISFLFQKELIFFLNRQSLFWRANSLNSVSQNKTLKNIFMF